MNTRLKHLVAVAGLAGALAGAGGLVLGMAVARTAYPPVEVLYSGAETVIGQPVSWPAGTPKLTAAIVTMQPGQQTGWHRHEAPLFAYMLEGELTVDYGDDGTRTYRPGEAFLEAFRTDHNGRNGGGDVARVLAVFVGAEGVANTVEATE